MSRGKVRSVASVCADCGAPDPAWASLNRGILVCNDCCSVHRSLGRHISQVKCLKKGAWSSPQLNMVHALYNNGANSIWEHSLLDPGQGGKGSRRKPNPRDPIHPTKADFIRAKHQMLVFVLRPGKDSSMLDDELSKQLHSSVRTANVETSLRLLSLGADPNYFHPEKGTSCLHVAAKEGQASQVELLVVYGADAGILDAESKSPVHYARDSGYFHLADRLVECQYEVTDRLAHYLCSRRPDHQAGQHYIIPEVAESSLDLSELAKVAKKKLLALPNNLFEELAMDVYDEVDRRETDAIWLSMQNQSTLLLDRQSVPFLPVNPEFSATRNQGRQKLARFNPREFTTLIIDILSDAKRRQFGSSPTKDKLKVPLTSKTVSTISDDEPLYDIVASDDESSSQFRKSSENESAKIKSQTAAVASAVTNSNNHNTTITPSSSSSDSHSQKSLGLIDGSEDQVSLEEFLITKRQLEESQQSVRQLYKANDDLKEEVSLLQNLVQNLMQENLNLRSNKQASDSSAKPKTINGLEPIIPPPPQYLAQKQAVAQKSSKSGAQTSPLRLSPTRTAASSATASSHQRPVSMYEPREQQRAATQWYAMDGNRVPTKAASDGERIMSRDDSGLGRSSHHSRQSCDYGSSEMILASCADKLENRLESSRMSNLAQTSLPSQNEIIDQTKPITRLIQDLRSCAHEGLFQNFHIFSEKIYHAVNDMIALFPQKSNKVDVSQAIDKVLGSALRLHAECKQLEYAIAKRADCADHSKSVESIMQRAFDIVLASKQLVNSVHAT